MAGFCFEVVVHKDKNNISVVSYSTLPSQNPAGSSREIRNYKIMKEISPQNISLLKISFLNGTGIIPSVHKTPKPKY